MTPATLRVAWVVAALFSLVASACGQPEQAVPRPQPDTIEKIEHLIVIYQENRSFDSLLGLFPGANGIANASEALRQVDKNGVPYTTLPQVFDPKKKAADTRFPAGLPVAPFDIAQYVPVGGQHPSPAHRFYHEQLQINGGRMDRFIAWTDVAGLVMGYYDGTKLPLGQLSKEYALLDNFFHSAFGNSFLNHQYLACACTPVWPNAPANIVAKLDANGVPTNMAYVTPDGFAGIETTFSVNTPHPKDEKILLPPQTATTIGDRLSEKGVSWAWYSGGWNDALAGKPHPEFQYHHQPFVYFEKYGDGTAAKREHLKDEEDFLAALKSGALPAVSFIKPNGPDNEHPSRGNILRGQDHMLSLVQAVQQSPYWPKSAIVITYDENGGFWDHVAPPKIDRWGPGTRVPAVIVSPFAKKGFIDHTQYETTSILKFIETRWKLQPLTTRDAQAGDLTTAFNLAKP